MLLFSVYSRFSALLDGESGRAENLDFLASDEITAVALIRYHGAILLQGHLVCWNFSLHRQLSHQLLDRLIRLGNNIELVTPRLYLKGVHDSFSLLLKLLLVLATTVGLSWRLEPFLAGDDLKVDPMLLDGWPSCGGGSLSAFESFNLLGLDFLGLVSHRKALVSPNLSCVVLGLHDGVVHNTWHLPINDAHIIKRLVQLNRVAFLLRLALLLI